MYKLTASDTVRDVPLGNALKVTLDHYYDILKTNAGNLQADEFLQLKLAADVLDISSKGASVGGYEWYSRYVILRRSDKTIEPTPVADAIQTSESVT